MYHHDIAYPIDNPLSREEEELGLALPDVLQPILRLPLFIHWVIYNAVLVAGEYYYFVFINKFLVGIEDMNIFNRFINEPLLPGFSLVSVKIFEILECSEVKGGLFVQNLAFSDFNNLNLGCGHKKTSFSMEPALACLSNVTVTVYCVFFSLEMQSVVG